MDNYIYIYEFISAMATDRRGEGRFGSTLSQLVHGRVKKLKASQILSYGKLIFDFGSCFPSIYVYHTFV